MPSIQDAAHQRITDAHAAGFGGTNDMYQGQHVTLDGVSDVDSGRWTWTVTLTASGTSKRFPSFAKGLSAAFAVEAMGRAADALESARIARLDAEADARLQAERAAQAAEVDARVAAYAAKHAEPAPTAEPFTAPLTPPAAGIGPDFTLRQWPGKVFRIYVHHGWAHRSDAEVIESRMGIIQAHLGDGQWGDFCTVREDEAEVFRKHRHAAPVAPEEAAPAPAPAITVTHAIPLESIAGMLCSALEGGSNYWYTITEFIPPMGRGYRFRQGEECRHLDFPLNPGGALMIADKHDTAAGSHRLDLESIRKGLAVMLARYPRHYADIVADRDDANTADVWLQCCLFGEVVFG